MGPTKATNFQYWPPEERLALYRLEPALRHLIGTIVATTHSAAAAPNPSASVTNGCGVRPSGMRTLRAHPFMAFTALAIGNLSCGISRCDNDGLGSREWSAREEALARPALPVVREAVHRRAEAVVARVSRASSIAAPPLRGKVTESFMLGGNFTLGGASYCHGGLSDSRSAYVVSQQILWMQDGRLHLASVTGTTERVRKGVADSNVAFEREDVFDLSRTRIEPSENSSWLWIKDVPTNTVFAFPADSGDSARVRVLVTAWVR